MSTMTITIERTPRTLNFGGKQIEVEELSVELHFVPKKCSLVEVNSYNDYKVLEKKHHKLNTKGLDNARVCVNSHRTRAFNFIKSTRMQI
jgi:hypothetical protein